MDNQYGEWQEAMWKQIEASPIVATCQECNGEIRQAEIDFGVATNRECASCVRDEVSSLIG